MPLSQQTIDIVKSTAPAVAANGEAIISTFYHDLLTNPDNKDIMVKFPHSHHISWPDDTELDHADLAKNRQLHGHPVHKETGQQQHALLGAVVAYALNIDNLGVLTEAVERIAHKHVQFQIPKEMYPTIGVTLLGAVKKVLGEAATEEVLEAWKEAYFFLADIFIDLEGKMMDEIDGKRGGWRGWREFIVSDIQPDPLEKLDVVHVYMKPRDGGDLMRYDAGQSVTVRFIDELPLHEGAFGIVGRREEIRNYTLSRAYEADPNNYRISVRREAGHGGPAGIVSSYIFEDVKVGDMLRVAPPRGVHTLERAPESDEPIVLVGGGIGMTSVFALFDAATRNPEQRRDIVLVHIVNDREHRVLESEIRIAAERCPKARLVFVHTHPSDDERAGVDYDLSGLVEFEDVAKHTGLDLSKAQWHFTGPVGFMETWKTALTEKHPDVTVFYEVYGPM